MRNMRIAFTVLLSIAAGVGNVAAAEADPRLKAAYWGEPVALGKLGKEYSYFQAFSPDGKHALVHHLRELVCFDVASAKILWTAGTFNVQNATFSPDGKFVVAAQWEDGANLYDAKTGKRLETFFVTGAGSERPRQAGFLPDGRAVVLFEGWSYDGPMDQVTQTLSYSLVVWDPTTRKEVSRKHEVLKYQKSHIWQWLKGRSLAMVRLQEFSENGTAIRKTIGLTDPATGQSTTTLTIHKDDDNQFDLSPDGTTLLVRTAGAAPRLIDVKTGELKATFEGHKCLVAAGAFSPDGKLIATVSGADISGYERAKLLPGAPTEGPTELLIFDATTAKIVAKYAYTPRERDFTHVAFSPDGKFVYTVSKGGRLDAYGRFPFPRPAADEAIGIPRLRDPEPVPSKTVAPLKGVVADSLDKLIDDLAKSGKPVDRQVEALYLAVLGRFPTEREAKLVAAALGAKPTVEKLRELLASLVASPEFEAHVKSLEKRRMVKPGNPFSELLDRTEIRQSFPFEPPAAKP